MLSLLLLKWKISILPPVFPQWHEFDVIICLWWQEINPECALNSQSALQRLSLDIVTAPGSFSSSNLSSLLTFCLTLAALLPIKPFITPKPVFLAYKAGCCRHLSGNSFLWCIEVFQEHFYSFSSISVRSEQKILLSTAKSTPPCRLRRAAIKSICIFKISLANSWSGTAQLLTCLSVTVIFTSRHEREDSSSVIWPTKRIFWHSSLIF